MILPISQVLILTISTLLLAGGGGEPGGLKWQLDQLQKAAKASVEDKAKQDEIKSTIKSMEADIEDFNAQIFRYRGEYLALDRTEDTTREEFQPVIEKLDGAWNDLEQKVLDGLFAIKELMTEAEWNDTMAAFMAKRTQLEQKRQEEMRKKQEKLAKEAAKAASG